MKNISNKYKFLSKKKLCEICWVRFDLGIQPFLKDKIVYLYFIFLFLYII